jgi:hypothetical protein
VVNDAGLAERVDELVDALPTQTRSEAELILKGLIISDYLFEAESYQPFVSVDLGYLYAATEGDAYDLRGLLERGAAVAARHALAAAEKLMPERKAPFRKRLFRWFFPSSAVPPLGESKRLAPLLAALGSRHLGFVDAEGDRRRRLARAWDEIFAEWQMVRGPVWGRAEDEPWPIRYPAFVRSWEKRPEIIRRLAAAGYEAGPFIYPRPLEVFAGGVAGRGRGRKSPASRGRK